MLTDSFEPFRSPVHCGLSPVLFRILLQNRSLHVAPIPSSEASVRKSKVSLVRHWYNRLWFNTRILSEPAVCEQVQREAEEVLDDSGLDDDLEHLGNVTFAESSTNEINARVKKNRKVKYTLRVLLLLREVFPFELTPRNESNCRAIRKYATKSMIEHGVHIGDRSRILEEVCRRYWVPMSIDFETKAYLNSFAVEDRLWRYSHERIVDHPIQRVLGISMREPMHVLKSSQ